MSDPSHTLGAVLRPTVQLAQPLPECPGCARPIARVQVDRTAAPAASDPGAGGVCSSCLPDYPEAFARARSHADRLTLERQAAAIRRRQVSRA